MAVPSSGELKLRADINLEVEGNDTDDNVSLGALSDAADLTTPPDQMSEFYGYSANVTINFSGGSLGNCSIQNNNLTNGQYTPSGAVSGQYWELQVNSGYGFQNYSSTSVSGLPAGMTYSVSTASGTSYGLGQGRIRITLGGNYPANSTNISLSVSGGSVTQIHDVTTTFGAWPSGGATGIIYGTSFNVGSFSSAINGGTYSTYPYNQSQTVKVWNGSTSVTVGYVDATIGEYFGSASGSANGTSGWSWSATRQSNLYRIEIVATKNSGSITGNTSLNLTSFSTGGGGSNFSGRTITQVSRTGSSSGGNWDCSNMSGSCISGVGYSTTGSSTEPRGKVWLIAHTSHTNQNWAYSASFSSWWLYACFASGGTAEIGTGGTNPDSCNSSSFTCNT